MPDSNSSHNPLGSLPINTLLPKFAIPSIVAYLVTSLYNIVDQIFIGQGVGYLGNAATNVAFPFTTVSTAIALMMGIGTAANFNLNLGAGNEERARRVAGTGLSCLALFSLTLGLIALFFRGPLLNLFGATPEVLPYAMIYTGITAFGLPMVTFTTGASSLVRADGSPTYSMLCTLSGAVLNTILDPVFIFGLDMGVAGAAWATIISQFISFCLLLIGCTRGGNLKIHISRVQLKWSYYSMIIRGGLPAPFRATSACHLLPGCFPLFKSDGHVPGADHPQQYPDLLRCALPLR